MLACDVRRILVLICLMAAALCAQSLSLEQAVQQALRQYPATRAAMEQAATAGAGVDLARTAYLPRVDWIGQVNRATRNNIFGMVLPQATLPSISGPPLATNTLESVWGSATGLHFSWEPFDFGQRAGRVEEARAGHARAQRAAERTSFEVSLRAADAFLTYLAATEAVKAADAGAARARALLPISEALVRAELRPGVDESRARAELARAETEVLQGRNRADGARIELAYLLGVDAQALVIDAGKMASTMPAAEELAQAVEHPAIAEQKAAVEQVKAAQRSLDRSWYPRFALQGATYARGTGALPDGRTLGGVNGLGPNIHNWGVGFTATFAGLDFAPVRARRQAEVHRERAEVARLEQVRQDLAGAVARARVEFASALNVAKHTPVQLEAARRTEEQAAARYKAGLSTIVDLTEAQRLVTQAEIDDAIARLQVWRALLRVAAAQGDIVPFLTATR
jgi:outer membrane protein TolC